MIDVRDVVVWGDSKTHKSGERVRMMLDIGHRRI